MDINQQIKSLRKERGISVVGMAKIIGVSKGLLYKIDGGGSLGSISVMERQLKALNCTIVVFKDEMLNKAINDGKVDHKTV